MSLVAIIDYGSGNLRSAAKAFERAALESGSNARIIITSDAREIEAADRIVLPGVGAFADCKAGLDALPFMTETLENVVLRKGRPFFGICVGMQLMASVGREYGDHPGLGWIKGEVKALQPADPSLKIPQMGWNDLSFVSGAHPLLAGVCPGRHAYFVHSYHFVPENPAHILASVDYGGLVTAMVGQDNIVGSQFHPEKSQETGLTIISNFLKWTP